jgi:hypothetical protein
MQRRAAAVSVVFFLVVSAASYGLIATAEEPSVGFENPEYSLSTGQSFEVGGQEYTVTSIEASMESSGGGHGGGGERLVRSGEVAWTNESARYTESWDNGSSVSIDNQSYTVVVDSGEDPAAFTLREELDREAILQDDPDAENQLVTYNGSDWVVINRDGNRTLVAPEEYFPEPATQRYEEGDQFSYNGQQVSVADVTADQITLAWTAPRENTRSLGHLENVTLQGSTYLVFFPNNDTVYLTQNFDSYRTQSNQIDRHHEHVNGLWGVSILSGLAAVALLGLAYLPSRY